MKEILRFAGDISVEKINLLSYDGTNYSIKNQLVSIQIFEDLFNPFITGIITFKDSLDFMNALPVIGQETLDIHMWTPTLKLRAGEIKGQFYVHKLKNREFLAEKSVIYELEFCSREAITDLNIKLSRGYEGNITDIVTDILSDDLVQFNSTKKVIAERTLTEIKYVSNYWSPTKNISYVSSFAVNENDSPTFTFFENRDGFNFASLETLMSSTTIAQDFKYDSSTQEVLPTGTSVRDVTRDYSRITSFSLKNGFNIHKRLGTGMIASSAFGYDLTAKRLSTNTFDYFSNFGKNKHLNKFPLVNNKIPSFYTAKIHTLALPYENFEGYASNTNYTTFQKRISDMTAVEDFTIEIQVPGRLDYTVGQVVNITSFQIAPLNKNDSSDQLDNIFGGRYIISAINHFIDRESHKCSIELVKDSYTSSFKKKGQ